MRTSSRLAFVAALAAAFAVSAAAHAQDDERFPLVVDRSMAGVELTMTKDQVRSLLGSPTESRRADDPFGRVQRWYFKGPKAHYYFRRGADDEPVVTAMFTRRGFVRGPSNAGVGTPESALRGRIDGLTCETFTATGFRRRSCYTGSFAPGQVVTAFGMRSDRVGSILVGFVID